MNYQQKETIYDYFKIEKSLCQKKERLAQAEYKFNNTNFHGSTRYDNESVYYHGFRIDTRVTGYVDYIDTLETHIKKLKKKQEYFNQYLSTLSADVQNSLKRRYQNYVGGIDEIQTLGSDQKVLDEIMEIEEAISYQFENKRIVSKTKEKEDVTYLEMKKVENAHFTPDTVESSFDVMTELLGV